MIMIISAYLLKQSLMKLVNRKIVSQDKNTKCILDYDIFTHLL